MLNFRFIHLDLTHLTLLMVRYMDGCRSFKYKLVGLRMQFLKFNRVWYIKNI